MYALFVFLQAAAPILPTLPVSPGDAVLGGGFGFAFWLWRQDRQQYQSLAMDYRKIVQEHTAANVALTAAVDKLADRMGPKQ